MSHVTINRDPFAREELVREVVRTTSQTCAWCGQRKGNRLFSYGVERDDRPGRPNWNDKLFCSVECYRTYHRR